MSIPATSIENFIAEQVSNGSAASVQDAEQELVNTLLDREIDRKIAQGRDDIAAGRSRVVNEATNHTFLADLSEKLLHK